MSKQKLLRRGTTAEHATFTGQLGEVTVDTTKNTVVVHDGVKAGGYPVLSKVDMSTEPFEGDSLFWDGTNWVAGVGNLSGLADVDMASAATGSVLVYDSTAEKWNAQAPEAGSSSLKSFTINLTSGAYTIDATTPTTGMPAGWTVGTMGSTSLTINHNVGSSPYNIWFVGAPAGGGESRIQHSGSQNWGSAPTTSSVKINLASLANFGTIQGGTVKVYLQF